jgi:hypothetical protein
MRHGSSGVDDRNTLESNMDADTQRLVIKFSVVLFVLLLIIAGIKNYFWGPSYDGICVVTNSDAIVCGDPL